MEHSRFARTALLLASLSLFTLAGCQSLTAPGSTAKGTPTATGTGTPSTTATPGGSGGGGTGTQQPYVSLLIADQASASAPIVIENMNPTSGRRVAVATLLAGTTLKVPPVVSPDGQLVAYAVSTSSAATLFVVDIAGLTQPKQVAPLTGGFSNIIWERDSAHVAVVSGRQLLVFGKDGTASPGVAFPGASALVGFAADNQSVFFVAAGDAPGLAAGALYRLPLADPTHPVQVSPREGISHYVLSRDTQTAYYDNSSASGSAGIYKVSTASATPTPQVVAAGANAYPVGVSAAGDLLYVDATSQNPALKSANGAGSAKTVAAKLVIDPAQVRYPVQETTVAPDGSAVAVITPLGTTGQQIFYTDLTASTPAPKPGLPFANTPTVLVAGWDVVLVAAAS